jgi:ribA/ribD-fused uncharacterized protein
MLKRIGSFRGYYRFLSNFWIERNGKSVEHYFQAAKVTDPEAYALIMAAETPGEAKRLASRQGMEELSRKLGRQIVLRPDWEDVCDEVMLTALRRKFQDPELRVKLLATDDAELIEANTWHDCKWGVCSCSRCGGVGENRLGRLLMQVRDELALAP